MSDGANKDNSKVKYTNILIQDDITTQKQDILNDVFV